MPTFLMHIFWQVNQNNMHNDQNLPKSRANQTN